ncbi:hypothetical protein ACTNEO_08295 [Gracilibacillus sp. HCP3S3_G5_1]|uniref:hypothetical protein n=1 Tax=unclassified Gracilibacillus TaxID=2625209 RepID=UPI003F8BCC90
MDNKKQISVRINQNKSNSPERKSSNQSTLEDYIRENHHPVIDDQHVFQRKYTPDTNSHNRSNKSSFWSKYKSFLISGATAVLIGSFLGVIMLHIFVDLDPEEVAFNSNSSNNQAVTASSELPEAEDDNNENVQDSYQSETFHFFVTQAGVFSSEEAANQLVQELQGEQIEGMIWPRDESYHVFVSVKPTNEASKEFTASTFPSSYEMYGGKEWNTNSVEIALSAEEKEWIEVLETILDQMIEGQIDEAAIDQWLNEIPANTSEDLQAISSEVESIKTLEDEQSIQVTLLQILKQFENLGEE